MAGMDPFARHSDYGHEEFDESHVHEDPLQTLRQWVLDADAADIYEPNAFVLGTIDETGRPTSRTVLLKHIDAGLVFVTNYLSRKGRAIDTNPRVSAVFGWYSMHRQVLVEGTATRVSTAESDEYFASRPRGSQIAAWASEQSTPVGGRAQLDAHYADLLKQFGDDKPVDRPPHWGGYRIVPDRIEFWKGRSNRMHDRIAFERDGDGWRVTRLQP
ncbi:MAG: pyridoxine/pyridoxamine 5-phosphate oxidase [Actinomycetota bacterium]|jgi:pyridoxamine 5'-phosphate oxidase